MTSQHASVEENARAALSSFILRARRVEEHSMAADLVALHRLSQMPITVQVNVKDGTATWIQEFPPEEQVESAAARVRPLILNDDPTFYAKFFNAVGYFLRESNAPEEARKQLGDFKKQWAEIQPKGQDVRGYYVERAAETDQSQRATDNVLGFAWIYGDVVHHDADRLARTRVFGVRERFRAAVPLVARIMVLTIASLKFARLLHREGWIPADKDTFEVPVTVSDTTFRQEGQIYLGDPGSADVPVVLPPLGQDLGEGWKPIHEILALTSAERVASGQEDTVSTHLHVQVVDLDGAALAAVDLDRVERVQDAEGIRAVLREIHSVFQVEDRYDLTDMNNVTVDRTLQFGDFAGQPACVVLPALEFIAYCRTPNIARVSVRHTPPNQGHVDPAWALDPPEDFRHELEALTTAIRALATIEKHASVPICVPDLSGVGSAEVRQWLFAARLLRGEEVVGTYPEGQWLLVELDTEVDVPDGGMLGIELPLNVLIGDQQVNLGRMALWLRDATLAGRPQQHERVFHAFTTPDRRFWYSLLEEESSDA